MKYGFLFLLLSGQLVCTALLFGGWFLLLFWPALCFGVIGGSYVKWGPRAFGKRDDGSMSFVSITLLLPYLGYLWTVWHTVRLVAREPAYNNVADGITIGRRLLSHERPSKTHTVVDLTCEFPEPSGMRSVAQYKAFPMLDATAASPDTLVAFVRSLPSPDESIYIHCAQGHGRAGLVTALLLVARGLAADGDEAVLRLQAVRPAVGLNRVQRQALHQAVDLLRLV
jgi:hypothetical protein